mmetsp:Transcript_653/g.1310  ORF Transcript_653/g.1310 Transcript_653/m.1310 type:complete len:107 (-) Transcript_653:2203-2523(-)
MRGKDTHFIEIYKQKSHANYENTNMSANCALTRSILEYRSNVNRSHSFTVSSSPPNAVPSTSPVCSASSSNIGPEFNTLYQNLRPKELSVGEGKDRLLAMEEKILS